MATAILISLLFLYLGCNVDLEWHVYDAEHNGKECKQYRCVCQNPICHDPTVQNSLMNLWDACALQTIAATYATAKEDLAVCKGAILPILSSVSILQNHGFDVPTTAGYLNPHPRESVTIIFDGFWSLKQEENFWLYVKNSAGEEGWIHRGMLLEPPR